MPGQRLVDPVDNPQRMEISEVRAAIKQLVHGQPVPDEVIQLARDTVQSMRQRASGYGLTEADVIRAVLLPSFERQRGCDCPPCKARRAEAEEDQIERWRTSLSQQTVSDLTS